MELVDRPLYLDRIEALIGAPVVKVLTGFVDQENLDCWNWWRTGCKAEGSPLSAFSM